jgi:chemotaxis protein methyltransferase CheR
MSDDAAIVKELLIESYENLDRLDQDLVVLEKDPANRDTLAGIFRTIHTIKNAMGFKRLRVWSAGCSTGEEPYTLAMFLMEESAKLLAGWTFDILATDLNDNSPTSAKAGIYGEYALRSTSELLRRKYFKPHDEKRLQVSDQLKSMIRFDRVNLSDDSKMIFLKGLDLIFCCNVLIYFDLNSKRRVMQHFYSNLLSGGYLFLGHAESLFQIDDRFRLVHFPGAIGYWKAPANNGVSS